jgi:hypothetical protein
LPDDEGESLECGGVPPLSRSVRKFESLIFMRHLRHSAELATD